MNTQKSRSKLSKTKPTRFGKPRRFVNPGGAAIWEIYNNKTGYPIKDLNTNAMCITKVGFKEGNKGIKEIKGIGEGREGVGVIWGGCGDDKVIRFDPRAVHKNSDPPTVIIQSIRIQERIFVGMHCPTLPPNPSPP